MGNWEDIFQVNEDCDKIFRYQSYLFVISMNVLSKLLDMAAANRKFGYHPKCKILRLTHLCFVDDLMVFYDGKQCSIEKIISVFDEFLSISGLNISLEKSTVYLAGVFNGLRQKLAEIFPLKTGNLHVQYLGLPLLTKRMTTFDYKPLIEKIRKRISSLTARFLSFTGRLQLLSSVIVSLTNFWISAYRLPAGCIREIEKICPVFLWSGPDLNPIKAKLSWTEVRSKKVDWV